MDEKTRYFDYVPALVETAQKIEATSTIAVFAGHVCSSINQQPDAVQHIHILWIAAKERKATLAESVSQWQIQILTLKEDFEQWNKTVGLIATQQHQRSVAREFTAAVDTDVVIQQQLSETSHVFFVQTLLLAKLQQILFILLQK